MADFKTHVTFSSAIGCGYAVVGSGMGHDLSTALVGGGLCGVAGMLPDVDSDSGVPRREALGFAAAIVPLLLVDRAKQLNLSHDQMVLFGAALYFAIRFVAADLIGRWSVHRGMWHSIPAIGIFAGLAFLIAGPADDVMVRYFKAGAVALGSFSHLILDEIYSIDTRGLTPRFKKSFGTAVKLWGKSASANFTTYAKLVVVVYLILMEPVVLKRLEERNPELANQVRGAQERIASLQDRVSTTTGNVRERLGQAQPGATTAPPAPSAGPQSAAPVTTQPIATPTQPPPSQWGQPFTPAPSAPPNGSPWLPAGSASPQQAPAGFTPNRSDWSQQSRPMYR